MELLSNIGLYHYLILALILLSIGLLGVCICKNIIKLLLCWQMIISSIGINFIAFSVYIDLNNLNGFAFQLFMLILTLLQVIWINLFLLNLYKNKQKNMEIEE